MKVSARGDTTLVAFGLNDGTKVQVLGSAVEDEKKRNSEEWGNTDEGAPGHPSNTRKLIN